MSDELRKDILKEVLINEVKKSKNYLEGKGENPLKDLDPFTSKDDYEPKLEPDDAAISAFIVSNALLHVLMEEKIIEPEKVGAVIDGIKKELSKKFGYKFHEKHL